MTLSAVGGWRLAVISAGGALEALHPLPSLPQPVLAVASDGCTVYYATATRIARINGCTGAVLADFAVLANVNDVEPQPNGDVLVAAANEVRLYNASGTPVRTVASLSSYGLSGREARQATAVNGAMWIVAGTICTSTATVLRIALTTGAEVAPRIEHVPAGGEATGIVVGNASLAQVPSASTATLVLLAFALAAGGSLMLRLR